MKVINELGIIVDKKMTLWTIWGKIKPQKPQKDDSVAKPEAKHL